MAKSLSVTPRTLRSWKANCNGPLKKRGRKRIEATLSELLQIAREWSLQGYPGSRPIIEALPLVRVKLIREVIAGLNEKIKRRYERKRNEVRVSVTVHSAGTVLTMDGATTKEGDLIVYRDRGSKSIRSEKCSGSVDSRDTLKLLEKLKDAELLPFVAMSDNGSPFCAKVVEDFYKENHIIHLRSLPRVPQHNGSCENGVGDLKRLMKFGLTSEDASHRLNNGRRRQSLNWQTSAQFEEDHSQECTAEDRSRFYEATCSAINAAVHGIDSAKERRKAEREAIFQSMERFELITRTRGLRHG